MVHVRRQGHELAQPPPPVLVHHEVLEPVGSLARCNPTPPICPICIPSSPCKNTAISYVFRCDPSTSRAIDVPSATSREDCRPGRMALSFLGGSAPSCRNGPDHDGPTSARPRDTGCAWEERTRLHRFRLRPTPRKPHRSAAGTGVPCRTHKRSCDVSNGWGKPPKRRAIVLSPSIPTRCPSSHTNPTRPPEPMRSQRSRSWVSDPLQLQGPTGNNSDVRNSGCVVRCRTATDPCIPYTRHGFRARGVSEGPRGRGGWTPSKPWEKGTRDMGPANDAHSLFSRQVPRATCS